MRLSIELLDHILSFLQSDPVSLKACCESHPLLSQLAERHLFTHVNFSSEFIGIIDRHPHIATYVRSIDISLLVYFEELPYILPMMTLLKKVKLHGGRRWKRVPDLFRQAFLDCIHSSSLEDVYISGLSDFPLSALDNVKRLTLCYYWREDECVPTKPDDSVTHPDKFQLESLCLKDFDCDSLQKVIAWVPSRTLRSLEISGYTFPYEGFTLLLDNCSNSLTHLQLDLGSHFRSCSTFGDHTSLGDGLEENLPFTLATLLNLQRFTVRAEVTSFETRDRVPIFQFGHPIPAIKQAVETISSQTLKRLKLDFFFIIDSLPSAEVIWSSLVHLVAGSPFPCVELHVRDVFCILGRHRGAAVYDSIVNSLADSAELMSYVNRGVLVISTKYPVTNKQGAPAAVDNTSTRPPIYPFTTPLQA